jgi:hypothetical protein
MAIFAKLALAMASDPGFAIPVASFFLFLFSAPFLVHCIEWRLSST